MCTANNKSTQESPNATFNKEIVKILKTCYDTLETKGKDYGPENLILGAKIASLMRNKELNAMDAAAILFGVKIARRNHLIETGATPENEPLVDTIKDSVNYLLIEERERRRYELDHPKE